MEDRALAERRLHPDTTPVHLNDLLGYRQSKPRSPLRFGVGAVHLMELLEYPRQLVGRYAGPSIGDTNSEMAVRRAGSNTHYTRVGELDGVAHEVEQHLR